MVVRVNITMILKTNRSYFQVFGMILRSCGSLECDDHICCCDLTIAVELTFAIIRVFDLKHVECIPP